LVYDKTFFGGDLVAEELVLNCAAEGFLRGSQLSSVMIGGELEVKTWDLNGVRNAIVPIFQGTKIMSLQHFSRNTTIRNV